MKSLVVALAVLGILATGCDDADSEPASTAPTYYTHVKPILDAHCVICHDGKGIAPFELTSGDAARAVAPALATQVVAKAMPPWLPNDDCRSYENRRSLSEDEIRAIDDWARAGAPMGDPADAPEPVDRKEGLSRVDLTLEMPVTFTQTKEPDHLRCFIVDWPLEKKAYVTGFDAQPGEPRAVHHMSFFVASPGQAEAVAKLDADDPGDGFDCFGGPKHISFEIGSWVPGMVGVNFPDRVGFEMEPGSKLVVQMHYNSETAGRLPDRSTFLFRIHDEVDHEASFKILKDNAWYDSLFIKAYDPETRVSSQLALARSGTLRRVGLHQHYLGKNSRLDVVRADGSRECVVHIPDYNFHWQAGYVLTDPVHVGENDKLELSCSWDNSAEHQRRVGGRLALPQDTRWGTNSNEEMCLGALLVTYD
jgi:hypothetical protein